MKEPADPIPQPDRDRDGATGTASDRAHRYLALFAALAAVSAFLPFFRVLPDSSDVQPYPLLLLLPVLLLGSRERTISLVFLAVVLLNAAMAVLLYAWIGTDFFILLSVFYFCVFLTFAYLRITDIQKHLEIAIKIAAVTYAVGTILQALGFDLSHVVTNFRTDDDRGFNSFTSEPSYLGLMSSMMIATRLIYNRKIDVFYFLIYFNLLSSASMAAILTFLALVPLQVLTTYRREPIKILLIYAFLFASIWAVLGMTSRVNVSVDRVVESPGIESLFADISIANRFARGILPLWIGLRDIWTPNGFTGSRKLDDLLETDWSDYGMFTRDRAGSPIGLLVYEIGVPAVILFLTLFVLSLRIAIAQCAFFCALSISLLSPANPAFIIYVAMLAYWGYDMRNGEAVRRY